MDSSLIFLALSGLWLLYLLPGWLSRRHQAKQSRVEDRFSDGIRTLTPRPDPTRRHPTGPDERAGGPRRGALLHGGVHESVTPLVATTSSALRRRPPAALGLAFLVSLAVFPVLAVLALLGLLPWALAAAPLVAAGASLGLVRWFAHRPARTTSAPPAVAARPDTVPTTAVDQDPERIVPDTILYDEGAILAVERAAAVAAARAAAQRKEAALEDLKAAMQPGEWLPVQVPTPTYLLKPNAPRRPGAPVEVDIRETAQDQVGIDLRETLPWVDQHAPLRRVAGD